MMVTFIQF